MSDTTCRARTTLLPSAVVEASSKKMTHPLEQASADAYDKLKQQAPVSFYPKAANVTVVFSHTQGCADYISVYTKLASRLTLTVCSYKL